MAAGISPTLTRCIEVCLQYLGLDGKHRKLVTTEPIVGVAGDGDLVTEDALLRTSGDTTAIQVGETAPVLWSRRSAAPGVRAVKPAVALRHHAQKAQPGGFTLIAAMSVEELFVTTEQTAPSVFTIRFYLRNRYFVAELPVLSQIVARVGAETAGHLGAIRWGNDGKSFAVQYGPSAVQGVAIFALSPRPSPTGSWSKPPTATLESVVDLSAKDWAAHFGASFVITQNWMLDSRHHILADLTANILNLLGDVGAGQRGYLVDQTSGTVLKEYGSGGFGNTGAGRLLYADSADVTKTIMLFDSAQLSDSPPGTPVPVSFSVWTGDTRVALPGTTVTAQSVAFGLLAYGRHKLFYGFSIAANPEATDFNNTVYQSDMSGNATVLASGLASSGLIADYLVRFLLAGSANTGVDAFYQYARRDQITTLPLPASLMETFISVTPVLDIHAPMVDPTRPIVPLADLPARILDATEVIGTITVQFIA
jgi:hypothetical protein